MQNITGSTRVSANFHVSNHRRPRNTPKTIAKHPHYGSVVMRLLRRMARMQSTRMRVAMTTINLCDELNDDRGFPDKGERSEVWSAASKVEASNLRFSLWALKLVAVVNTTLDSQASCRAPQGKPCTSTPKDERNTGTCTTQTENSKQQKDHGLARA